MFTTLNHKKWSFALTLLAASCTAATETQRENQRAAAAQTQAVQLAAVTEQFTAPGTVRAKLQTVLSSKLVGQVAAVLVREGDRVHRGELLVEIEGPDVEAQLHRAEAGLTEARRAVEEIESSIRAAEAALRAADANRDLALSTRTRYDMLRRRGSVSPQEFDEVDARYNAALSDAERARELAAAAQARRPVALARIEQAEADLSSARAAAGYLRIVSPIDGVVTARKTEPGMLAAPGMPLLALDDDSSYQLEALVEESRIADVRIGRRAAVEIDAAQTSVDAVIVEIGPPSSRESRTYTVKLDLALTPALRRATRSGLFGRALFPAGERQALVIPESGLVRRGQLTGVYVVHDGRGLLRLVKTGKRYEQGIEILSGLDVGDRIICAPGTEEFDGVKILPPSKEGNP